MINTGLINIDDKKIPYVFNIEKYQIQILNLSEQDFSDNVFKIFNTKSYNNSQWIPSKVLTGECFTGNANISKIIFDVLDSEKIIDGQMTYDVTWYAVLDDDINLEDVDGISFEGGIVNDFYNGEKRSYISTIKRVNNVNDISIKLDNKEDVCGTFDVEDYRIKMSFFANSTYYFKSNIPVKSVSGLKFEFMDKINQKSIIKLCNTVNKFFMFISYSPYVWFDSINLLKSSDGSMIRIGKLYLKNLQNEGDTYLRIIPYDLIEDKCCEIIKDLYEGNLSNQQSSIMRKDNNITNYKIFSLTSEADHEYQVLSKFKRSKEYNELGEELINYLECKKEKLHGKKKEKTSEFERMIKNCIDDNARPPYETIVKNMLNECSDVLNDLLPKNCLIDNDKIDKIAKSISIMRNGIIHSKPDFKIQAEQIYYLHILERLLYAYRLKHYDFSDEKIKLMIERIFN